MFGDLKFRHQGGHSHLSDGGMNIQPYSSLVFSDQGIVSEDIWGMVLEKTQRCKNQPKKHQR